MNDKYDHWSHYDKSCAVMSHTTEMAAKPVRYSSYTGMALGQGAWKLHWITHNLPCTNPAH
jgi:hypothetical protein